MKKKGYRSIELDSKLERRDFLKIGGGSLLGAGLLLGRPPLFGQETAKVEPPGQAQDQHRRSHGRAAHEIFPARAFSRAKWWRSRTSGP